MSEGAKLADEAVLVVVDVQVDFCPGGALAVPRGDEIIPLVNSLAARFRNVGLTQDWRPRGHASFASSHPGKKPFETVAAFYGPQVLWPTIACRTRRAPGSTRLCRLPTRLCWCARSFRPAIDSYSAIYENDRRTPTAGYLRERGLDAYRLRRSRLGLLRSLFGRKMPAARVLPPLRMPAAQSKLDGSAAAARESLATLDVPCLHAREFA